MITKSIVRSLAIAIVATMACVSPLSAQQPTAKNAILFVGDGMGVSTVSAARIFSVGVDGNLILDQAPFVGLSKTFTTDYITPDSAGTMTAMISGVNTNSGVIGLDATTERGDFNNDGDGAPVTTLIEMAKAAGKSVGIVSTARITHATPAACYAKVNERNAEEAIALQLLPTDATYNTALGGGVDVIFGGGRRFFVPNGVADEEGSSGRRTDGRDLRAEFQAAGYTYVWNQAGFNGLTAGSGPVIGLFENSHMEYEFDRSMDVGGEPSLEMMTAKAIEILSTNPNGYFLMVESGRIDHAHHAGNAYRAMVDTEELDQAIGHAAWLADLAETTILATADHSHVFNIQGYPLRPLSELPYALNSAPAAYAAATTTDILFSLAYGANGNGDVGALTDANGTPITPLVYGNGPGYRTVRQDPTTDTTPGVTGAPVSGPGDPNYLQDAAIPMGSETHSGEDVAVYGIGPYSSLIIGTRKNTNVFQVLRTALGL